MIFLIAYDRKTQTLMQEVEVFDDSRRKDAYNRRLDVELALPAEAHRYEVVLLEAESREVIEQTHARYFFGVAELARSARADLNKMAERLRKQAEKRLTR